MTEASLAPFAFYALILPVLLLVPKRLINTVNGQTPEVAFTAD
jgi:hypothetical protein